MEAAEYIRWAEEHGLTTENAATGSTTEYAHDEKGKRVDVHRPTAIDPANYELAAPLPNVPWYKSGPFFDLGSVSGTCYHCGHAIRYATKMVYLPTGEKVTFGADCTDMIDLPSDIKVRAGYEFTRLKKRAANEARALREAQTKEKNAVEFKAQNPEVVEYLENVDEFVRNYFIQDMKRVLNNYGYLTPGQLEATKKSMKREEEYIARKLAEAAADVEPTAPLEAGRYAVTGEVLTVKWQDDPLYGGSYKMKVRLDSNACKVYGTMPKSIVESVQDVNSLKGKTVSFTATFKPTEKDEFFGYFSRPAQGKVK